MKALISCADPEETWGDRSLNPTPWKITKLEDFLAILVLCFCLFDLILYVSINNLSVMSVRSSWVEPVLSKDKCVFLKDTTQWQYWFGSPSKSQSYQASIQCWSITDLPGKRHLNGVSLAGRFCPLLVVFGSPHQLKKPKKSKIVVWVWSLSLGKLSGSEHACSADDNKIRKGTKKYTAKQGHNIHIHAQWAHNKQWL